MNYNPPQLHLYGSINELTGYIGGDDGGDALFVNGITVAEVQNKDGSSEPDLSCSFLRVSNTFTFIPASRPGGATLDECNGILNQWKAGDLDGEKVGYTEY